jgi:hypothetical protein
VPKKSKKVVLEPAGKDLKQFQAKYASTWKTIVDSPAWLAGAQFIRNRALEKIALLSDDDIEKHGREHLAELRGILRHENDMESLYEMTDFTLPFEDTETVYRSPEQVAEMQMLEAKFQAETKKQRYA